MAHAEATHVEAKAPTCYENGNIEYWYCEDCGQAWLDAECTLNTNLKAVILPTVDGFVTAGSKTYYYLNGEKLTGLALIDGSYYYFSTGDGNMKKNTSIFVSANDLGLARGSYKVAADGKIETVKNGFFVSGDKTFYYVNGEVVKGFRLIYGNAYYFSTGDGNMKKNGAVIWAPADNAAGLERGQYIAGEDGVLTLA